MRNDEHFGLIGLKARDIIESRSLDMRLMVASGNGTPENGGKLVIDHEGDLLDQARFRYLQALDEGPPLSVPIDEKREDKNSTQKGSLKMDLLLIEGKTLYSLKLATKYLLGPSFDEEVDYWELWEKNGSSLRKLLDQALA